jgi:hypothetical protein
VSTEAPTTSVSPHRARSFGLAIGMAAAAAGLWGLCWAIWPDFFSSLFRVEYTYNRALRNYEGNLRDFPWLLGWLSAALGALAAAVWRFEGRGGASLSNSWLPRWLTWPAVVGMLGVAGWTSHQSWVF